MSPRDTSTGQVLEAMILPALKRGGYSYQTQQKVSDRPGGRRAHCRCDCRKGREAISRFAQMAAGFRDGRTEGAFLSHLSRRRRNQRWIHQSLSGSRRRRMDVTRLLYGGGLASHLVAADKVSILTREHFVASANQGKLWSSAAPPRMRARGALAGA